MNKTPFTFSAIAIAMAASQQGLADDKEASINKAGEVYQEQVLIIGKQGSQSLPGSAFAVSETELEKFNYSDIHSVLRNVPGVYIQQEEGYGLRPNIGIRGAGGRRSEKITLMEDGVLIAPAPYAGPSAYYFPTTGRMSGIEILKGPETIKYGPYTVGGAVNLVSTPIPQTQSGELTLEMGEDADNRLHVWYGASAENFGWLVETHQHQADGFKDIDRSSEDTGLDKKDYMIKLRANTEANQGVYHQVDLKINRATEMSNQSYLGLTYMDFRDDPNRRYGMSVLDEMDNEQTGISLAYFVEFNENLSIKTTMYHNEFERDWYKLNNKLNTFTQAQLDGVADVSGLELKHNAREYEATGIQSTLNVLFDTGSIKHDLEVGVRLHEDEVDRFQPVDIFNQVSGQLVYQGTNAPSSSNNRIEEAESLSLFVMDHIAVNEKLEVTAGFRYEDYETEQTRYTAVDRSASTTANENAVDELMFALGASYDLNAQWQLLAGVHQGFAATDAGASNVDPEESINYEAGFRFKQNQLAVELIGFFSDYSNSVQNCTVNNPCGTLTSGSRSQGEAEIKGVEFLTSYEFSLTDALTVPVSYSWTITETEITKGADDGSTLEGDQLTDIPENQMAVSAGLVSSAGWDVYLNGNYMDKTCVDNACSEETQELVTWDLAAGYQLNESVKLTAKVDNVFDRQEIVSLKPDGARANKPRTAYVGVVYSF